MYDVEIAGRSESVAQVPAEVQGRFRERGGTIIKRTMLPWGEHCTECAWPTCYTTCDLFTPKVDGRCGRFVDGMVRMDHRGGLNPYLVKVRFKRWGRLWALGNVRLFSAFRARVVAFRDRFVSSVIGVFPAPASWRLRQLQHYYGLKKRWAKWWPNRRRLPEWFVLECYNPQLEPVKVTMAIRRERDARRETVDMPVAAVERDKRGLIPFQQLIELAPGFSRVEVPVSDITQLVDLRVPFGIELSPNEVVEGTTLYFGFMDFVIDTVPRGPKPAAGEKKGKKCKCVVWDLDNTAWEGILVEDGADAVRLKPGVADVIKELDQRGILHSIASKNNPEDVMKVLERFELSDYFLYPQISWGPKGKAVAQIAKLLNIGVDTLMFVDDQPFEREEVKTVCPEVTVIDARECLSLPDRPEFQVPVTQDSVNRRKMYRQQRERGEALDAFDGHYLQFIKDCHIQLRVKPMREENLQRVHELAQRTNQMNFSGNRYERSRLVEIMASEDLCTYVMECEDKFGSYGTVGFSVVDRHEPRMIDLMFSCRIQSKRVEHAFLAHILREHIRASGRDFHANYRKTERNAPSGKVFADMGFEEVGNQDGVTTLVFRADREVPDDGVIEVVT